MINAKLLHIENKLESSLISNKLQSEVMLLIREAITSEAKRWADPVMDELVSAHILTDEHYINPYKAVKDAIAWNCNATLDPLVSSDAQALIDLGAKRSKYKAAFDVLSKHSVASDARIKELSSALEQCVEALDRVEKEAVADKLDGWYADCCESNFRAKEVLL